MGTHQPTSCNTIPELLAASAAAHGNAPAIESIDGTQLTYAKLQQIINNGSADLLCHGITRNDRVAIVMPNGPGMALALLAISSNAIAVPLNPASRKDEFTRYFAESRVTALVIPDASDSPAIEVAEKHNIKLIRWTDKPQWRFSTPHTNSRPASPTTVAANDLALILPTSGSTGQSKIVPLSHRNVCTSAADVCRSLQLNPKDRCLSMWEQYHIGGLVDLLLAPLASGGCVICAGGFNAQRFHPLLESHAPTWFQGVPTTLLELLRLRKQSPEIKSRHSLRLIRSVAAALPPDWMAEIEGSYGVPVIQTYGMTEASPLITSNLLPPGIRKPGSTGKPCGPDVAIFNNDGQLLANGNIGAIAVRGANVISEYENNPQANAESFRNGWFFTGDTGYFDDDGFLFLHGRTKELINRGGEKISPFEVEDVLTLHPDIDQACVFATPHPTLGENVAAAIVTRNAQALKEEEIRNHALNYLSPFKVPHQFLFLDSLPRCPVGKIRRRDLAAMLLQSPTQSTTITPQSDMERFLAHLWAEELDINPPGIDESFTTLGGDSLSSVRLLTAIEALLGTRFPDATLEHFTTIRHLANHLDNYREPNATINPPPTQDTPKQLPIPNDLDIKSALATASIGNTHTSNPTLLLQQLQCCKSEKDFETLKSSIENEFYPNQYIALANQISHTASPASIRLPPVIWQEWIESTQTEIRNGEYPATWQRHILADHAFLYSDPEHNQANKQLIVCLTGNAQRPMMPIFRFLLQLNPHHYDVLLVRDPERNQYANGIRGICNDLASLCDWLKQTTSRMHHHSISGFGTSAGALPAIAATWRNHWNKAIVFGADSPSRHPSFANLINQPTPEFNPSSEPELLAFYGSDNARDKSAAKEIIQLLPNTKPFAISGLASHNLLHAAFRKGQLGKLFKLFLQSQPLTMTQFSFDHPPNSQMPH